MSQRYYFIRNLFTGPTGANLPCSGTGPRRSIIYSSDEEDDVPPRQPPFGYRNPQIEHSDIEDYRPARNITVRNRRQRRNPFIETDAGVDGDASTDEDDGDGDDLDGFIVDDDVF